MKKLGLVLVVVAAIALVYAPVMAADKAAAPTAPAAVKTEKAAPAADKAAAPAAPAAVKTEKAAPAKADKAAEKPAVKAKAKKEPVTLTGMVIEVKNKKGKVTVAIQTDKDTITVISKGKGAELAKMVGKKVEAKGNLNVSKKGKKSFYVFECKEAM